MLRFAICMALLVGCSSPSGSAHAGTEKAPPLVTGQAEAIFAGGCFLVANFSSAIDTSTESEGQDERSVG